MSEAEVLLSIPLAISIGISFFLGMYVGIKSKLRVKQLFVLMIFEVCFLAIAFWFELLSGTLGEKLIWNDLEYIVNVTIPPLFLLFTLRFLGMNTLTGPKKTVPSLPSACHIVDLGMDERLSPPLL